MATIRVERVIGTKVTPDGKVGLVVTNADGQRITIAMPPNQAHAAMVGLAVAVDRDLTGRMGALAVLNVEGVDVVSSPEQPTEQFAETLLLRGGGKITFGLSRAIAAELITKLGGLLESHVRTRPPSSARH